MVRPYAGEADALWELKREFELQLGGVGGDGKAETYARKLDETYRREYLEWVRRCVAEDERAVQVADVEAGPESDSEHEGALAGYVFVLPESLAYIWDAAVLNEVFVREEYRGSGVADDLMAAALSVAREQSLPLERMVLDVDRTNDRARAFYDRWGFEGWGEMVAREL